MVFFKVQEETKENKNNRRLRNVRRQVKKKYGNFLDVK